MNEAAHWDTKEGRKREHVSEWRGSLLALTLPDAGVRCFENGKRQAGPEQKHKLLAALPRPPKTKTITIHNMFYFPNVT